MVYTLTINIIFFGIFTFLLFYRGGLPVSTISLCIGYFSLAIVGNLLVRYIAVRKHNRQQGNYIGLEKRSFFRVVYRRPGARPRLQVSGDNFPVADISQSGVRFINDRHIFLDHTIEGTIVFSDGETVHITGEVEWKKNDEISLLLKELISHTTISKERHHVSRT